MFILPSTCFSLSLSKIITRLPNGRRLPFYSINKWLNSFWCEKNCSMYTVCHMFWLLHTVCLWHWMLYHINHPFDAHFHIAHKSTLFPTQLLYIGTIFVRLSFCANILENSSPKSTDDLINCCIFLWSVHILRSCRQGAQNKFCFVCWPVGIWVSLFFRCNIVRIAKNQSQGIPTLVALFICCLVYLLVSVIL
jgi:hypothetical protein